MTDTAFIIIIGLVLTAMCYVIINQMLLNNSVNKRLIVIIEDLLAERISPLSVINKLDEEEEDQSTFYDPYQQEVE